MASYLLSSLLFLIVEWIALMAFRITVAISIYFDSKALGIKNYVLWIVLAFFFPIPVAVVYLICRKKVEKVCPKRCNMCGVTVHSTYKTCPQCGNTDFTDYIMPDKDKNTKVAKRLVIASACCVVVAIVCYVMCIVNTTSLLKDSVFDSNPFSEFEENPYSDFFDNFDSSDMFG